MKKLLFILIALPMIGFGQKTYVPDDSFEAYLEANGMGDGIAFNDSVLTSNINTVSTLSVNNKYISSLTGIEDFTSLSYLQCDYNQITSLDVSNNFALTQLHCGNNQLTYVDISQNPNIFSFSCEYNLLTILDLYQNTNLNDFWCNNNQLISLDMQGIDMYVLVCDNNQLTVIDNLSDNVSLKH